MQSENLRDVAAAIGLEVRQGMRPGQVVRSGDVVKPQLVKRGEVWRELHPVRFAAFRVHPAMGSETVRILAERDAMVGSDPTPRPGG